MTIAPAAPASRLREPEYFPAGDPDEEPESGSPIEILTLDEFLERECAPLEWLVPELIPAHGVTLILGGPGTGKTLFAFDCAAQVAAGGKRVLIIEEEGSERGFQDRLRRAADAAGLDSAGRARIDVAWNTGASLLDYKAHRFLVALARERRAQFVVLDSLAALSGGIDENDPPSMAALGEALHDLKSEMGGAVAGIHHFTKESWKPGHTPTLANGRGHGNLYGRIDTALGLVPLDCPAGLVRFELYCMKQRDAERTTPRRVAVLMTGPAAMVTMDRIEPRKQEPSPAALRVAAMKKEVLEVVPFDETQAMSGNAIVDKLRKHKPTVLAAIKQLVLDGELSQLGNSRVYRMKAQKPSDSGRYARYRSSGSADGD